MRRTTILTPSRCHHRCAARGDDVIVGSSGDDVIEGLGGNDPICGLEGADTIRGGEGDDRLFGGADFYDYEDDKGRDRCLRGERLSDCEVRR